MRRFLIGASCMLFFSMAGGMEPWIRARELALVFTERQAPLFQTDRISNGTLCRVLNWKGEAVAECAVKGGQITLPVLPKDYYRLVWRDGQRQLSQGFAVIDNPADRKGNRNYSMVTSPGGAFHLFPKERRAERAMDFFSRLYHLAGLEIVRDYTSWRGVEPKPGEYEFRALDLKLAAGRNSGARYLYLVESAPAWTVEGEDGFPTDLRSVYEFGKAIAAYCGNHTAVWEFYNEIENKYRSWEYAAALKAFYLGVKAGNPAAAVAITSYCHSANGHVQQVFQNGTGNYFDLFNIHTYDALQDYPARVEEFRQILEKNNLGGKKIWITESNTRADGDAKIDIGLPGIRAQSFEQELIVAEYIPKSHLILQQQGVARNFTFVLRPCNEQGGKRAWGLLREDLSAKPGLAAFATLTGELGNAELLGEVGMPNGVRGFLFRQPDRSFTLVLWSESELDRRGDPVKSLQQGRLFQKKVKLASNRPLKQVEIFGRESLLPVEAGAVTVEISRFPVYLHGVEAMPVVKPRQREAVEAAVSRKNAPSPVVLSMKPVSEFKPASPVVLLVPPDKVSWTMELRLWNLSDEVQTGSLVESDGILSALPERISLLPWECRKIPVHFSEAAKRQLSFKVKVSGTFNDVPIGDFFMPCILLDNQKYTLLPIAEDSKAWHDNVVRGGKTTILPRKDSIRFEVTFPSATDNWVYPKYTPVDAVAKKIIADAVGIYFEIRVEQDRKSKYNCVWIDTRNRETGEVRQHRRDYFNLSYGDWVGNFIYCGITPEEEITGFGIGLGPVGTTKINYELRNIRVLEKQNIHGR